MFFSHLFFFLLQPNSKLILDVENTEWHKIEDDGNIECSQKSVNYSGAFVEASSLTHWNVLASVSNTSWMVADWFYVVFTKSFKVELRNFHDYMQSNEMNDSYFNFHLEWEEPAVDSLTIDSG